MVMQVSIVLLWLWGGTIEEAGNVVVKGMMIVAERTGTC